MLDDMILFCTSSFGRVEMHGIPSSILMNHIHSLNEHAIVRCWRKTCINTTNSFSLCKLPVKWSADFSLSCKQSSVCNLPAVRPTLARSTVAGLKLDLLTTFHLAMPCLGNFVCYLFGFSWRTDGRTLGYWKWLENKQKHGTLVFHERMQLLNVS